LGPITETEISKRIEIDFKKWLQKLETDGRIVYIKNPATGWITKSNQHLFDQKNVESFKSLIMIILQTHGPVSLQQICKILPYIPKKTILSILDEFKQNRKVVSGRLTIGCKVDQWCETQNFSELYRITIGRRRVIQAPADRPTYNRFIFAWHTILDKEIGLSELFEKFNGYKFPTNFFEREILASRYNREKWTKRFNQMKESIANGDINVRLGRFNQDGRRYIEFLKYGEGSVFDSEEANNLTDTEINQFGEAIIKFLKENGASRLRELELGSSLNKTQLEENLSELCLKGIVCCDNYETLLSILKREPEEKSYSPREVYKSQITPDWIRGKQRSKPSRAVIQKRVQNRIKTNEGRWFLTKSFAVVGKTLTQEERAEKQVRLLLNRYGILVKQWYRHESGLLPWYNLFKVLKKLEWQGEIRRGYFVDGLSGLQFASTGAIDLLDKIQNKVSTQKKEYILLSTIDPALPFGGVIPWNLKSQDGNEIQVTRLNLNHIIFENGIPVIYLENFGNRLWFLKYPNEVMTKFLVEKFKFWLLLPDPFRPRKKIEIEEINGIPAIKNKFMDLFLSNGFEHESKKLTLWPSGI